MQNAVALGKKKGCYFILHILFFLKLGLNSAHQHPNDVSASIPVRYLISRSLRKPEVPIMLGGEIMKI